MVSIVQPLAHVPTHALRMHLYSHLWRIESEWTNKSWDSHVTHISRTGEITILVRIVTLEKREQLYIIDCVSYPALLPCCDCSHGWLALAETSSIFLFFSRMTATYRIYLQLGTIPSRPKILVILKDRQKQGAEFLGPRPISTIVCSPSLQH